MTKRNCVATTQDWLRVSEGMTITAYEPGYMIEPDPEVIEPDEPVHLPADGRQWMNHAQGEARLRGDR